MITIQYQLTYAERKTLEISVHPDLRVTVIAPEKTSLDAIEARVQKRAKWILRQQRELELYLPHIPPRQYISGETHRYLGKQYRLKVIEDASEEWVKLYRGYLVVRTLNKFDHSRIKELVNQLYLWQAYRVFNERIRVMLPRFGRMEVPEFDLQIKILQSR